MVKLYPNQIFFALGRTFVYLLTGKQPHDFPEDPRTGELIWRDSATDISPKFADLIDYLMAPFPGNRPQNTQEILQRIAELSPSLKTSQPVVQNPPANVGQVNLGVNPVVGQIIQSGTSVDYILFGKRVLAYGIDLVILGIWIIIWVIVIAAFDPYGSRGVWIFALFMMFLGVWLYFALFESSSQQATVGKQRLKIIVTNLQGNRISFWQATWRLLLKLLFTGLSIWGIGLIDFLFALFRKDRRSLHDIFSRTVVVNNNVVVNKP